MDRKSIIILVASFIVLMLWYPMVNKLYPPKPLPAGLTNSFSTNIATSGAEEIKAAPTNIAPVVPVAPPVSTLAASATAATQPEQTLQLTNAQARYTFTSRGGGLKLVELLSYRETISNLLGKREKISPHVATLNEDAPVAALAMAGTDSEGAYILTPIPNGIRAQKDATNGLRIVKEYTLSTNYLVSAVVRLENTGSVPMALPPQQYVVGTATPMGADDNGQALGMMWFNGSKTEKVGASFFSTRNFACMPRTPPPEYRAGTSNVFWAAVHNQFFTLAAMPLQPALAVVVQRVPLPAKPDLLGVVQPGRPAPEGFVSALVYPETTLAPGQSLEKRFFLFGGPKEYQTLARLGDAFKNELDAVMGYTGFMGFFAKALLLSMNWLHDFLKLPYAWAIITITIIIKLVFWPLTQASTRSMKRMQALQPQMKAIQEKYKGDPAKMNKKTMEFMKENKVSPLGGCLPMLLQIPVFFGFYSMIQSAIELRGASFLWINDLSKADTLFMAGGFPVNLLPLLMGATMLWQAKLTPPSPGMDPAQAKIMKYMPLMFMVFLYNFSAGLTLYWTVQNLLTIAQTKLTKTEPAIPVGHAPALTPLPKKKK